MDNRPGVQQALWHRVGGVRNRITQQQRAVGGDLSRYEGLVLDGAGEPLEHPCPPLPVGLFSGPCGCPGLFVEGERQGIHLPVDRIAPGDLGVQDIQRRQLATAKSGQQLPRGGITQVIQHPLHSSPGRALPRLILRRRRLDHPRRNLYRAARCKTTHPRSPRGGGRCPSPWPGRNPVLWRA